MVGFCVAFKRIVKIFGQAIAKISNRSKWPACGQCLQDDLEMFTRPFRFCKVDQKSCEDAAVDLGWAICYDQADR